MNVHDKIKNILDLLDDIDINLPEQHNATVEGCITLVKKLDDVICSARTIKSNVRLLMGVNEGTTNGTD